MATVTTPRKHVPVPLPTGAQPDPQPVALDPARPHLGDRVAFAIWVTCFLFMVTLLTYDAVMALFR
jgi:hypothetical protein